MAAGSSNSTRQLAFLGLDDDLIAAVLDQSPEGSLGAFASASRRLTRLVRCCGNVHKTCVVVCVLHKRSCWPVCHQLLDVAVFIVPA
jgi:hypothetical protein